MPRVEAPKSPLIPKLAGLHLFHFEGAPCAQRVRFALAEKGLRRGREVPWRSDTADTLAAEQGTWTSRHVSLIRKDHLTPEYAEIQPHMVVPALVHDGRLYIESMDIVRYLDERFGGSPLVPADPSAAAEALDLVERGKALHRSIRFVSFHWGLGRLGKIGSAAEATLRRLERKDSPERLAEFYGGFDRDAIDAATYRSHLEALEQGFDSLEQRLASDGRAYLMGEAFSIADIIWSIKVLRLRECGYPFARNFPALSAWYRRVSARPGFRNGVMERNRAMSAAFRAKSAVENLLGVGLAAAARPARAAA